MPDQRDVCFDFMVPESTANANAGVIEFQLKASTSMAWVALGTGSAMVHSNIFVMYADGNGNVTVSLRRATSPLHANVLARRRQN